MLAECSFDGCGNPRKAKGHCGGHYEQLRRGAALAPLGTYRRQRTECSFEGCKLPHAAVGYCNGHYRQHRLGRLRPLYSNKRRDGSVLARDDLGRKECGRCREWRPESDYHRAPASSDGLSTWCPDCVGISSRAWRYGMSFSQVEEMLTVQGGRCAACGNGIGVEDMQVDHDHSCCPGKHSCGQCVRALLHGRCNRVLGQSGDNPRLLRSVADYAARWVS